MKVDAVRNLNVVHNYNFGAKEKVEKGSGTDIRRNSSMMTKVPVIVLLAMNPATLNSAIPQMSEIGNQDQIVMLTQPTERNESVYVTSPAIEQEEQSEYPFGWASLDYYTIKKVISGKNSFFNYDILFTTSKNAGIDPEKEITDIFMIKKGARTAKSEYTKPPKIEGVVHHKLQDGREFYTVKLFERSLDQDGIEIGAMRYETRIDNESAKELVKLLTNQTRWENTTLIKLTESNTPSIMKPIKY